MSGFSHHFQISQTRQEKCTFVFPLESLYRAEIFATVIVVEGFVLLLNPVLRFVHVSVEPLNFMGRTQLELTLLKEKLG